MAGPSKNSRSSRNSAVANGPVNYGAFRILIPVGSGSGAYVFNPATGKNPRLRVDSTEFADQIREIAEAGQGAKLVSELQQLHIDQPTHGWDGVLARLQGAGVL